MSERSRAEGWFSFKGVESHAFEEITERQVKILRQRFQDFDHSFFHPGTDLDAGNLLLAFHVLPCYHVTDVTQPPAINAGAERSRLFRWPDLPACRRPISAAQPRAD